MRTTMLDDVPPVPNDVVAVKAAYETGGRLRALDGGALQRAICNCANLAGNATDAKGVIQIFNVGAEPMLGHRAVSLLYKITPLNSSDPAELRARACALSEEFEVSIAPGFDTLVFKASRGIEDIYELNCIRHDGSSFPVMVSVTALRDADEHIIGYLLIGTDSTARDQAEDALHRFIAEVMPAAEAPGWVKVGETRLAERLETLPLRGPAS